MKLTVRSFSWNSSSKTKGDAASVKTETGQASGHEAEKLVIPIITITEPDADEPTPMPPQLDASGRRTMLPAPMTAEDSSLFTVLKNNVGKDMSTVTLPVSFNEPLSLLQRMVEDFEYTELLEQAVATEDGVQRLALVATFAISSYAGSRYRSGRKPFNPMLGETYEYQDDRMRFISEKVCHHPPVMACNATGEGWEFWTTSEAKNRFTGKSFEIVPIGWNYLRIGEDLYRWDKPSTFVRNIISGTKYLEHVGALTVENSRTGQYCHLEFKEPPLFSWGKTKKIDPRSVEGLIYNKDGVDAGWKVTGSWDKDISLVPSSGTGSTKLMWQTNPFPPHAKTHYGFNAFATVLNQLPPPPLRASSASPVVRLPAPTDSRYRPDQRALENGGVDKASHLKQILEEAQRNRRAAGDAVKPRWFKLVSRGGAPVDPESSPVIDSARSSPIANGTLPRKSYEEDGQEWEYLGGYWEAQERGWEPEAFNPPLWPRLGF